MTTITSEAAPRPEEQLEAIRSMLVAGHHSITLELHSFALWGVGSALALQIWPRVFTPARFADPVRLAVVELATAALLMALVAAVDFRLSVRAKRRRDETFSWVQRQMGKQTLLFAGLALLLGFGSHFYPWYSVIYVFFVGLMGITLMSHGLFSEPFLVWTGLAALLLAAAEVALRAPFGATHWLATAAYGVGVTTLGPLHRWVKRLGPAGQVACALVWICLIAAAGSLCYELTRAPVEPSLLPLAG